MPHYFRLETVDCAVLYNLVLFSDETSHSLVDVSLSLALHFKSYFVPLFVLVKIMDLQQPDGIRVNYELYVCSEQRWSSKKRELFTYKSADFRLIRSVRLCHFVQIRTLSTYYYIVVGVDGSEMQI